MNALNVLDLIFVDDWGISPRERTWNTIPTRASTYWEMICKSAKTMRDS